MPELPEVETVVRELKQNIVGKKIVKIDEFRSNTVFHNFTTIPDLGKVIDVKRRGKYLIVETDNGFDCIIHLRMTGKLIIVKNSAQMTKHTRAVISFLDDTKLLLDDIRTFGTINIIPKEQRLNFFCKLGCEPFSEEFNSEYLSALFASKKMPIKNLLLAQDCIAGLGNIYVNEILYSCKISPNRSANSLNRQEIELLITKTRKILTEAIRQNGTSISDFRRIDNKSGSFQNFLKIYGKDICSEGHPVKKLKIGGRSTFYCPECQKEKLG